MKTRIISGLAMVPLLLIIYFGGYPLLIAAIVLSAVGVTEFYNGFEHMGITPSRILAYMMIAILYIGHLIIGYNPLFISAWLTMAVMVSLVYGLDVTNRSPADSMATLTGLVYIVFFLYSIVLIDQGTYKELTWMVVFSSFITDIFAYFTGSLIGKHKLCPNLSPKKTIEGAVGGVVGSGIVGALFGYFVMPEIAIHCVIIGIMGGIVSEFGDLVASAFKRKMDIKDYGNLIPGHGGIMDRFDSFIFVAPIVYFYTMFLLP